MQIESDRLSIREWAPADRAALERMVADPDMMRYLTKGRTWARAEVDEFLDRQARQQREHDCSIGPLVLKHSGEVVGVAGIQPLDLPGAFELAWWVWKDHWRRGYASEIADALIAHARAVMRLERIYAVIDPPNAASVRVAEKAGLAFERLLPARETAARRDDAEVALYARTL